MEDDIGIVTSSCCSEWSLVFDRNRVYHLGVISKKARNLDVYLKKLNNSLLNVPESLRSKNPYPQEKHGRT